MQQKPQPPYMSHKPFKILFGLTLLASFIFAGYIVLAGSCQDSCILQDSDRAFECYIDDIHYCCSAYSIYGPSSCGYFTDCVQSTDTCEGYFTGMIVSGSIAMILMISMIVVGVQFSKKHNAMMQTAYQAMSFNQALSREQNQGYSMHQQPPANYANYQNTPFNQTNNQLIVNGQNYNPPRNQLN